MAGWTKRKSENKNIRKSEKALAFLNRYSLLFHALLACFICFLIEWVSRHSFVDACSFAVDRNLVFLYNSLIVFASLMLAYTTTRRALVRTLVSVFWLFLGIINGCVLAKRVSPFSFTDLKMIGDLFTMKSNYFSTGEAILVITGVAAALLFLVVLWIRGPKYQGRTHRLAGLLLTLTVVMMIPEVTDAAVSSHILTDYFENLAQGYRDYGFVYSFSSSVLDRGMQMPKRYSEDAVNEVLAKALKTGGVSSAQEGKRTAEADVQGALEGKTEASVIKEESIRTTQPGAMELSGEKTEASAEREESIPTADSGMEEGQPQEAAEQNTQGTEKRIPEEDGAADEEYPNIICILLESFIDPELISFLELDAEAVPFFHSLYHTYSSGYCEVPVVGAGTANTEFEILTGMGMQFFGLGEYPYKTILKQTNCESIASDLGSLGYGTHVVHNNGGNFYSRRNAFSMMGFDTFTSKELMDIHDYTPTGNWPTDEILIGEVEKALDYTPDQPDFVYTITVQLHGDYPREPVLENPAIHVSGVEDEGMRCAWEYYVNQIHEVDRFLENLISMLEQRGEKTFVVMFGDHLPTMGLTAEDMKTGSLFRTQYATWNNFGLGKSDRTMTSYQLLPDMLESLGIRTGTMVTFHQNRHRYATEEAYQEAMELLQYDILYGNHYVYGGENPYPASDLIMGTQEVLIDQIMETDLYYYVIGQNFTRWSKIFLNGEKISTSYLSSSLLRFQKDRMAEGRNEITVCQVGSSDSIFRTSNVYTYQLIER